MTNSDPDDPRENDPSDGQPDKSVENAALMDKLKEMGVASDGSMPAHQDDRVQHWWSPRFMALPLFIVIVIGLLLLISERPTGGEKTRQVVALGGTGTAPYPAGRPGSRGGARTPTPPANWRPVSPLVRPPAMSPAPGTAKNQSRIGQDSAAPPAPAVVPPQPYFYQYPRNPVPYQRYTPYPPPYYTAPPPGYGPYPYGYYPPAGYYFPRQAPAQYPREVPAQ